MINDKNVKLDSLNIKTNNSNLNASYLRFKFNSFDDFSDFVNNVKLETKLLSSQLEIGDIAYFAEDLYGIKQKITLSGIIKGKINDIKAKNLEILYGKRTMIKGNFNITGLPDIDQTFMFLNFTKLAINISDLEKIQIPPFDKKEYIKIPAELIPLGEIIYKGSFTGLVNDFVAYGDFNTAIGVISSDILIKKETKNDKVNFSGNIKTQNFNIGTLLKDKENFGVVSLNAKVNGNSFNNKIYAKVDGMVQLFELKKYMYQNIKIEGELTDKKFDGNCSINDPNIKLDFLGLFDFSEKIPVFDFTADVSNAKLFNLNLYKEDSISELSFLLDAKFKGDNLDDIQGKLELYKTNYKNSKIDIQFNDLVITKSNNDKLQNIAIASDLLDANIEGNVVFSSLVLSVKKLINYYTPAYFGNEDYKNLKSNNFSFNINLKYTKSITDVFLPTVSFGKNTTLSGKYNSELYSLKLDFNSPLLLVDGNKIHNLKINAFPDNNKLFIDVNCSKLSLTNGINMDNIKVVSNAHNNSLDIKLNWLNNDSVNYSGNINSIVNFVKSQNTNPLIDINIMPSHIVYSDSLWNIGKSKIIIDSINYYITGFNLINKSQNLNIEGKISNNSTDSLFFNFNNVSISNFNLITNESGFNFKGALNGRASLSNIYNDLHFYSDLSIDSFIVNTEYFGNLYAVSKWNTTTKMIDVSAYTKNGNIKTFDINGTYFPTSSSLDFDIELVKFNLHIFDKYLDDVFDDLRGILGGNLKLTGTTDKPLLNGKLMLQKTAFTIDYLQARWNFSSEVDVINNNFILKDVALYDTKVNKAILNGKISNSYFSDIRFDLDLKTDNFMVLNTTESDNNMFYGTMYMGGAVKFYGTLDNLNIDITAKTGKHSQLNIPLTSTYDLSENNYITFTNNKKDTVTKKEDYSVNLSGIQLKFDIEVTPDAEIQIIFDPKIGDIIKERGNANIKMEINTLGKFQMFGTNVIESGDYLFTLQNVINKKFEIENGGTIKWTGDPYNAMIDLKAIYKTKAALSNLMTGIYDDEAYKQRTAVECVLNMTDNLTSPNIKFGINVPMADSKAQTFISSFTEAEINKQLLSLLVINSFYTPDNLRTASTGVNTSTNPKGNALGANSSELLTNQLNHWLSQISDKFDLGVNYRAGDQVSRDEAEVALSTQILDDRVSINGNLGVGGKQTSSSNLVGDFNIDVKLNKNGKLRAKGFTKTNDNIIYDASPSTQGLGLFYREEFDTVKELFRKYLNKIKGEN